MNHTNTLSLRPLETTYGISFQTFEKIRITENCLNVDNEKISMYQSIFVLTKKKDVPSQRRSGSKDILLLFKDNLFYLVIKYEMIHKVITI